MNPSQGKPPVDLIATLGTEPQVVTAALDLLIKMGVGVRNVIVIHTVAPGTPIQDALRRLEKAFEGHPYEEISLRFVPISGEGHLLHDIDTHESTKAAFHVLYNQGQNQQIPVRALPWADAHLWSLLRKLPSNCVSSCHQQMPVNNKTNRN